eukprot:364546-Chlamydomonas_euryale.AAC.3
MQARSWPSHCKNAVVAQTSVQPSNFPAGGLRTDETTAVNGFRTPPSPSTLLCSLFGNQPTHSQGWQCCHSDTVGGTGSQRPYCVADSCCGKQHAGTPNSHL